MSTKAFPLEAVSSGQQAALLLHALADADRRWLLERLPSADADALRAMLEELQLLGIPRDASLASQTIARPAQPVEPSIETPGVSVGIKLDALGAEDGRRLAELFADEPPHLMATLLAGGPWAWEASFLSALPVPQGQRVKQRLQSLDRSKLPVRQLAAIRQAAEQALQECMPIESPPVLARAGSSVRQPPWWRRLWRSSSV